MADEGRTTDSGTQIGSLWVNVGANTENFDAALKTVNETLRNANKDVHIRIGITDAQLGRLQRAYQLLRNIQQTGVTGDLAQVLSASTPRRGGSGGSVSFDEKSLTKAMTAAFGTAIGQLSEPLKITLDTAHLQSQIEALQLPLRVGGAGEAGASTAQMAAVASQLPATFKREVESATSSTKDAISDVFTHMNSAARTMGTQGLGEWRGHAEALASIMGRLGPNLKGYIKENKQGEITGGTAKTYVRVAGDPLLLALDKMVAGMSATAAPSYYREWMKTRPTATTQAAPVSEAVTPAAKRAIEARERAEVLAADTAQRSARNAQAVAAQMGNQQPSVPVHPVTPADIAASAGGLTRAYRGRAGTGAALTQPWESRTTAASAKKKPVFIGATHVEERGTVRSAAETEPLMESKEVSKFGRALSRRAYGKVGVNGIDLTDLMIAAGPGMRLFGAPTGANRSGWGQIKGTGADAGQLLPLTPETYQRLRSMPRQTGVALGRSQVRALSPREALEMAIISRGVDPETASKIGAWSTNRKAGGPLGAPELPGGTGVSLTAAMSGGGGTLTAYARDVRSYQVMGARMTEEDARDRALVKAAKAKRAELNKTGGAATEMDNLKTDIKAAQERIRQRSIRMGDLRNAITGQTSARTNAASRAAIAAGEGAEPGANGQPPEQLGADPLSRLLRQTGGAVGTSMADRPAIVRALELLGKHGAVATGAGMEDVRNLLVAGGLPTRWSEEGAQGVGPGGLPRILSPAESLWQALHPMLDEAISAMPELSIPERSRRLATSPATPVATALPIYQKAFEKKAPMLSAGMSALFGNRALLQYFSDQAIERYPEPTGTTEARLTEGPRPRWVGSVAPGRMSKRYIALQNQYDSLQRDYDEAYGRKYGRAHDPLAAGLPPGTAAQERLMGAQSGSGPRGTHPTVLLPKIGEVQKIESRARETIAHRMGITFNTAGAPIFPSAENPEAVEKEYARRVRASLRATPRYQELTSQQGDLQDRLAKMGKILREHTPKPYYRTAEGPHVVTPDELIRVGFSGSLGALGSAGGAVPYSGVPVTQQEALAAQQAMASGNATGVPMRLRDRFMGEETGAPGVPPGVPPGGAGQGGQQQPFGNGPIHVFIDGPFPLAVAVNGEVQTTGGGRGVGGGMARGAVGRVPAGAATPEENVFYADAAGQITKGRYPGQTSEQAAAARQRRAQLTARDRAMASQRPTRSALLQALAGANATPEELAVFAQPVSFAQSRQSSLNIPDPMVIVARQRAREAQALLPSRALSTSLVQLSQRLFGGREEPERRIFQLQRATARLDRLEGQRRPLREARAESYLDIRNARGQIAAFTARGEAVPEQLTKELKAAQEEFAKNDTALKMNTTTLTKASARVEEFSKTAVTAKDVVRNLAAGFVGGIAGGLTTMGVSAVLQVALSAASALEPIFKPAYEAAIGYQNVTNKVISSVSDEIRANKGLVQQTVALDAAQKGLAFTTYQRLAPALQQAGGVEAGNKAYQDYIDTVRAGTNVGMGGAPRGLYQTTNGLNVLGLQTPIGGTPSTIENFLNSFSGVIRNTPLGVTSSSPTGSSLFGVNVPVTHNDVVGQLLDILGEAGGVATHLTDIHGYAAGLVQSSQSLKASTLSDWNAQLAKMPHGFKEITDFSKGAQDALQQLTKVGLNQEQIDELKSLGVAFTDASGKVITGVGDLNAVFTDIAQGPLMQDPRVVLAGMAGPTGTLTQALFGLQQSTQLSRLTNMAQIGLQSAVQPLVTPGMALQGMQGVPGQFSQAYAQGIGGGLPAQFDTQGIAAMNSLIDKISNPEDQAAAHSLFTDLQDSGTAIAKLQTQAQQITLAQTFRQFNQEALISKRTLGDIVGLAGQVSVSTSTGAVGATEYGQLERSVMMQSHQLQLMGFQYQQKQLNYQTALAGFQAPGATGEEIAARERIAKEQASYQQQVLNKQQSIYGSQWSMQQIDISRQLQQATYGWNELNKEFNDQGLLTGINTKIAAWQRAQQGASALFSTYANEAQGYAQLTLQAAQEVVALGGSAATAIDMATVAMQAAAKSLQTALTGGGTNSTGNTGLLNFLFPNGKVPPWLQGLLGQNTNLYTQPNGSLGGGGGGGGAGGGGGFAIGAWNLSQDQVAKVHKGEMIIPATIASELRKLMGSGALAPMSQSQQQNFVVQINNPSAGVDTAALTRVVINELNRQVALRNGFGGF